MLRYNLVTHKYKIMKGDKFTGHDALVVQGLNNPAVRPTNPLAKAFRSEYDKYALNLRDSTTQVVSPMPKAPEDSRLTGFKSQFEKLANGGGQLDLNTLIAKADPNEKGNCQRELGTMNDQEKQQLAWYIIATRLLNNRDEGKLMIDLADGLESSSFIGVDGNGKALFADGCPSFAKDTQDKTWLAAQTYVSRQGYEMFPDNENSQSGYINLKDDEGKLLSDSEILKKLTESGLFSKEVLLYMQNSGKPIVERLKEGVWNGIWVASQVIDKETGKKSTLPRYVGFDPVDDGVYVSRTVPSFQDPELGVRRLLRV
ncbi:MAG: hypothetical protein UR28_C0008G0001 [Candidatus Peregrinibacteria bacterium GW2011_GWF2_33_10]|nr:MAG: hypothetical protein UR28_C0008G0001 [Candidatus Peregrinibacteria bacterium GW2011_GWF2_33_10]